MVVIVWYELVECTNIDEYLNGNIILDNSNFDGRVNIIINLQKHKIMGIKKYANNNNSILLHIFLLNIVYIKILYWS